MVVLWVDCRGRRRQHTAIALCFHCISTASVAETLPFLAVLAAGSRTRWPRSLSVEGGQVAAESEGVGSRERGGRARGSEGARERGSADGPSAAASW